MFFFADSCFYIGYFDKRDSNHRSAEELWNALNELQNFEGWSSLLATDYILIEVFQTLQNRIGFENTKTTHFQLCNNCRIDRVTRAIIDEAIETKLQRFCNHTTGSPKMGLVDGTSLVVMDRRKIPRMISFDDHFSDIPLVRRIFNSDSLGRLC